jgi:hypothetical protein
MMTSKISELLVTKNLGYASVELQKPYLKGMRTAGSQSISSRLRNRKDRMQRNISRVVCNGLSRPAEGDPWDDPARTSTSRPWGRLSPRARATWRYTSTAEMEMSGSLRLANNKTFMND